MLPGGELLDPLRWIVAASAFIFLSGFFSTLRVALELTPSERVLERIPDDERRSRIQRWLEHSAHFASSAAVLKVGFDLAFVAALIGLTSSRNELSWPYLFAALGIAAPLILVGTEALPRALARSRGDELLARFLPTFRVLQLPVSPLVRGSDALRRALLRALHLEEDSPAALRMALDLREVIEEAGAKGRLDEQERELIENVMEFRDVDAAAVMTPRTELTAVDVEDSLDDVLKAFAECRHSRLPVYEESIDTIIGTVAALDVARVLSEDDLEESSLRDLLRPAFLVPETKHVSELLTEFRAETEKVAIVVDEYGGTAGMVTLVDVLEEIVGDLDEEEEGPPVRELDPGHFEVQAGLHVTEVNEACGLELPEEEDYETLGGYVLARLGHFPKEGESFTEGAVRFAILEASDRRVFRVAVVRSA